ncbi:MAG: hypothetical protein GY953_40740 [bacterium]|nr:hypothetical protein [bacterium]
MGAKTIAAKTAGMATARIACASCHQVKEVSSTGTVLWKASLEKCADCHDDSAAQEFPSYYETLRASLSDLEFVADRVRTALDSADLDADRSAAIGVQLDNLLHDVDFLRVGNGIHNIHYANTLTRALVDQLSSLCSELNITEAKVTSPQKAESSE